MNIASTSSAAASTTTATSTTASTNDINPDDFLELLIAQLQTQDPLSPMDTGQMVSQLSTMQMVSENRATRQSQDMVQAMNLLGRTVSWQDQTTGTVHSGQVSAIARNGSEPLLVVGDSQLKLDQIMAISSTAVSG